VYHYLTNPDKKSRTVKVENKTSSDENINGLRRATRQVQTYQFTLPENADETQLTSSLNDQGTLEFNWKTRDLAIQNEDVETVEIEQTDEI